MPRQFNLLRNINRFPIPMPLGDASPAIVTHNAKPARKTRSGPALAQVPKAETPAALGVDDTALVLKDYGVLFPKKSAHGTSELYLLALRPVKWGRPHLPHDVVQTPCASLRRSVLA